MTIYNLLKKCNPMKIYDLLFYVGYKLSKRSGNFDDTPILGGCMFVGIPIICNVLSILFILNGLGFDTILRYSTKGRYTPFNVIMSILTLIYIYAYYKYKGRYKKILIKYERKNIRYFCYWLIYILYIVVSGAIMITSGMFMNRHWIFSDIPIF